MVQPPPAPTEDPALTDEAEPDPSLSDTPERRCGPAPRELHGQRLDKIVVTMAAEFSRNHLQGLIEGGYVRVDGKPVLTPSRKMQAGQMIEVELVPTAESRAFRAEPMVLSLVYEDDDLLVVDKPAGLVVHPAPGNWSATLLNGLLAHHPGAATLSRAGIVHRLDKDTSGLMVVGKRLESVTALSRAIAAREVGREYLAIVHGKVRENEFNIAAPIGRDPQSRVKMAVVSSGRPARTDVSVQLQGEGFTGLRCKLHTGRTHQIRVHLASRGHPLVSDAVYGGRPGLGLERQALHATRLEFLHPISGNHMAFEAPPPADFASAWRNLLTK